MNESTLTRLKIVVERAVRPVRASVSCKRKMREELLAHVIGVFEEEFSRLDDEHTALERTALRFGNPSEVTSQFQESVPAGDAITRFFEGRPGESMNWGVLRLAHPAHELGPFDLDPGHSTSHGLQGGRMRVCRIGIRVAGCRAAASPRGMVAPADRDAFVEQTLTPGKQFP